MTALIVVGILALVLGLGWAATEATVWVGEWWEDRHRRILAREWPEVAHWETHPAQCPICYPGPRAESTDWAAWAREVGGR